MEIQVDFEEKSTQQILLTLLKEGLSKGRVFVCDECDQLYLREDKASVESQNAMVCKTCAKLVFGNNKSFKTTEDNLHLQIKSILDKIAETEHEYNDLIEASRQGIDWENEIESRRLRIQTLKRSLLDAKHKAGH